VILTFAVWLDAAVGGRRRDQQDKSRMMPLIVGMSETKIQATYANSINFS
jgi:hypothetical protein